ncbi:MAG: DUF58 domain-containing protein [Bacteroidia bacterium]|nr:DUF58 domain-containing protein [Bacteroidia bacterium]
MDRVVRFYKALYLSPRFFLLLGVGIALFLVAYMFPELLFFAKIALLLLLLMGFLDGLLLFISKDGLEGKRKLPERFSNGDDNPVKLEFKNNYGFTAHVKIQDEVPFQFQRRDEDFPLKIPSNGEEDFEYSLRPTERGEYKFGVLNAFVSGPLGLVERRYKLAGEDMVPCYPSYIQMRKYQLMAISNRLTEFGVKQIRRLGHTSEFEQIKEYVRGDDYRTINWKATARAGKIMVNQYMDERSQQVYCLVDKSRVMKMPFEGLSLLDYAINASLVISNIAIHKHDKAGLITFCEKVDNIIPPDNRAIQMNRIMEVLYKQETDFLEADYERLYSLTKRRISARSLLILFTNFESISAMRRQLPFLQSISQNHLLMVVFFENTELNELLESQPQDMEEIYIKTIGEDFAFKKQQIAKELEQHGIIAILTPPANLTVNTLNKYLELKARGMA